MKPPPLPNVSLERARAAWVYVGCSAGAILTVALVMSGLLLVRARGVALPVGTLGTLVALVAVGVCGWSFFRCPKRPLPAKLVCLALLAFSLYIAADWIANWAVVG